MRPGRVGSPLRRWRGDEEGSDIVSFVILMPLFMFVLVMMLSVSQLIYGGTVAMDAANAGCRMAIVETRRADAAGKARAAAETYLGGAGMGVTFDSDELYLAGGWKRGEICYYRVTVRVKTMMTMPGYGNAVRGSYLITKTCPMMIEKGG